MVFTNLTGISILYPVVAPVILMMVSIKRKFLAGVDPSVMVLPSLVKRNVLVANSMEALILNLKPVPRGPRIEESAGKLFVPMSVSRNLAQLPV